MNEAQIAPAEPSIVHISDFAQGKGKLPESSVVPVDSISYQFKKSNAAVVSQLRSSIGAPWGRLLVPLLVSKQHGPRPWRLRDGYSRLQVAKDLGLTHVRVVVVDGSDEEVELLTREANLFREHVAKGSYLYSKTLTEWYECLQATYEHYTAGGDKAAKSAAMKAQGLPNLDELIRNSTGLGRSAFYDKVASYKKLIPEVRQFCEQHPESLIARVESHRKRLLKYDQAEVLPYLGKEPNPTTAYFQLVREKSAHKGSTLPVNEVFPIYHEPFWENAKRIADGSVDLIATDPNWQLSEEDGTWVEGALEVAPKMTLTRWETFAELAAQKLAPTGLAAILLGQQNSYEVEAVLRKHLQWRWTAVYLHLSGSGTAVHRHSIASRCRLLLLYERKDAPETEESRKEFVHDVFPFPKGICPPADAVDARQQVLDRLKADRKYLDARIDAVESEGDDLLLDDVIMSKVTRTENMKQWHPWAQNVDTWREIIRRLSKPGQFVWEPFAGSGTTAVAAVTCEDRVLKNGNWVRQVNPRRGIGCDIMPLWADVARFRIWEAQGTRGKYEQ